MSRFVNQTVWIPPDKRFSELESEAKHEMTIHNNPRRIWSSARFGGIGVFRTMPKADGVAGMNRQESKLGFPKNSTWVPTFVSG
jgi:hypothetical protein